VVTQPAQRALVFGRSQDLLKQAERIHRGIVNAVALVDAMHMFGAAADATGVPRENETEGRNPPRVKAADAKVALPASVGGRAGKALEGFPVDFSKMPAALRAFRHGSPLT